MKFLFDLDGTLTTAETLPLLAQKFNLEEEISSLTNKTVRGDVPFIESFIKRVNILKKIGIDDVKTVFGAVKLHSEVIGFIKENLHDCVVVTGNCRVWVQDLVDQIGCEVFASDTELDDSGHLKLKSIVRKEDVVRHFQSKGEEVVFIGDGNNDAEAMRQANYSIASGLVHMPARSVLDVCDYLIFDESSLVRQLNQIKGSCRGLSVILSCAGVGSRLGLAVTKALLRLDEQLLIDIHLDNFEQVEDLRVVVGFQSMTLVDHILQRRRDVIFVFNHDYFHSKTGFSYYLGARHGREYSIEWDGDLLVHPKHVSELLVECEYAAGTPVSSDEPILMTVKDCLVESFEVYDLPLAREWTGPCCLKRSKVSCQNSNVYNVLTQHLPLRFKEIEAYDIDTYDDYLRVASLVRGWK